MIQGLREKFDRVFSSIRGRGLLTPEMIEQTLKEMRIALLEADVHYKVVNDFVESVRQKASKNEVLEGLAPSQQVVQLVWKELVQLLGGGDAPMALSSVPTIVMLVGLQGSGKTTTAGKLAKLYKEKGKRVMLVAADLCRPAAVDQLRVIGERMGVPVFLPESEKDPVVVASQAVAAGRTQGIDLLLIDTAGRHELNEALLEELVRIKREVGPHQILFIADALAGQVAVQLAQAFHHKIGLTGVILTKTEGDARGGAALSIRLVSGVPIRFIGTGEKLDALEIFYPDRIASRILGMGDMASLLDLAGENPPSLVNRKEKKGALSLDDFRIQLKQFRGMGRLEKVLGMIPGFDATAVRANPEQMEREMKQIEAMTSSMTCEERENPSIINGNRRLRIARGSGTSVQQINRFLKQFDQAKKMFKQLSEGKMKGWGRMMVPR